MKVKLPILKKEITMKMLTRNLYKQFNNLNTTNDKITVALNNFINGLIIEDIDLNEINFVDRNFIVFSLFLESNGIVINDSIIECDKQYNFKYEIGEIKLGEVLPYYVKFNKDIKCNMVIPKMEDIGKTINWIESIEFIKTKRETIFNKNKINDFFENDITSKDYNSIIKKLNEYIDNYFGFIKLVPLDDVISIKCDVCDKEIEHKIKTEVAHDIMLFGIKSNAI